MMELLFQLLALSLWRIALPVLYIVLTPVFLIRALSGRGSLRQGMKTRYRMLWLKWVDAFPIDELS